MVKKTLKCPDCKSKVTIQGNPGENGSAVIEVNNLTKKYNDFKAVDTISFNVNNGDIFGFLGPNGAGKTTTIKMLTTILRPTNGKAKICGYDITKESVEAKKRIGYMPDVPGFYGEMKAEEVLNFYAEFYKIPKEKRKQKVDDLLEMMQLTDFKKRKVKTFSRGMKQKLGFASSLINDPEVLILDEPTIGLDPATIHFFRNSIKTLNENGVTVFLSSHILSEVQALCNKVGIIHHGKIIAVDTIKSLGRKMAVKGSKTVCITFENMTEKALKAVKSVKGVVSIKEDKEKKRLIIEIESGKSIIPLINKTLMKNDIDVTSIETQEINLEDIFLSLTGEN